MEHYRSGDPERGCGLIAVAAALVALGLAAWWVFVR